MPLSNAEKSKRYRERHPERFRASLLKYWKTKYECECGKTLTKKNRAVHLRGAEHKKYADYMGMKRKIESMEKPEIKEDSETSSEEEEYINNYLSNGKYDKDGLVITTDSDTED